MEQPPAKRSRRLNQIASTKRSQCEAEKRKVPLKLIKPTTGGKNGLLTLKEKVDVDVESADVVTKKLVKVSGNRRKDEKQLTSIDVKPKVAAKKIQPKKKFSRSEAKATVKRNNGGEDGIASGHDDVSADEGSVVDVIEQRKVAGKDEVATDGEEYESTSSEGEVPENRRKYEKQKGTSTDVKPKLAAKKIQPKKKFSRSEAKATVKRSNGREDGSASGHDDVSADEGSVVDVIEQRKVAGKDEVATDGEEYESTSSEGEVPENRRKYEKQKGTSTDVKPKLAAKKIQPKKKFSRSEAKATVKRSNGREDGSASGHDDVSADEGSVVDVIEQRKVAGKDEVATDGEEYESTSSEGEVPENRRKYEKQKGTSTDVKPKVAAKKIQPKKKFSRSEAKATVKRSNGREDGSASGHDDVSADERSVDDVIDPKIGAGKVGMKPIDGKKIGLDLNTNAASLSVSKQIDAAHHTNDGSIFKIMSRIERKLDDLVRQQVNEKRMFALVLRMPFDHVIDINQYNLDIRNVDLFLQFVKYFGCVGGNNDGKIVCNILHHIATPNLLSQFEWQISSPKSFQALKNVVKVIHTAANEKCSEKFDMTVCGDVIKNVLRNARGGSYKK